MNTNKPLQSNSGTSAKKAYAKPEVRHERIFETQALTCGKVQATQAQCTNNRKLS
jgi:hypothetical protein